MKQPRYYLRPTDPQKGSLIRAQLPIATESGVLSTRQKDPPYLALNLRPPECELNLMYALPLCNLADIVRTLTKYHGHTLVLK